MEPKSVPEQPEYRFWADPALIPRGADQIRYKEMAKNWPISSRYAELCYAARTRENGPVAPERRPLTKDAVRARAFELGARAFGVTLTNPLHVFKGRRVDERYTIALGQDEDPVAIGKAPSLESNDEVLRVYYELGEVAIALAAFLRDHGYPARAHQPLGSGDILAIPHAIAAGLGELGKHGSMIHPEYGSLFRIALVTTDLELPLDAPRVAGLADVCTRCKACERACPPGAISSQKQDVRGSIRYIVDFDRCLPFFIENYTCGVCIKVCPWNQPNFVAAARRQYAERATRA